MKRKQYLRTAAAVLSAAMLLGGCGGSKTKEAGDTVRSAETETAEIEVTGIEAAETETAETEAAEIETAETEAAETETAEAEQESVGIRAASPYIFSEGLAWVELEGGSELAVVDADGKIRFTLEHGDGTVDATPFYDGASAVYIDKPNSGYAIYSAAGELLASSDDGDDTTSFQLLGSGDGKYLIEKTTTSFSENSTVLYCIDKNGNKLTEEAQVSDGVNAMEYRGDGLFANTYSSTCFLDGRVIKLNDDSVPETERTDLGFRMWGEGEVLSIKYCDVIRTSGALEDTDYYKTIDIAQGQNYPIGCWFNQNCELVTALAAFPEGVTVDGCEYIGEFDGGYAYVGLRGADGQSYYTIVDQSGNPVYEPVKIEGGPFAYAFHDGAIAFTDHGYVVLDKDGTLYDAAEDLSAFTGSILPEDKVGGIMYGSSNVELTINEGVKYMAKDGIYRKLDSTPFDQAVLTDDTVHVSFAPEEQGN